MPFDATDFEKPAESIKLRILKEGRRLLTELDWCQHVLERCDEDGRPSAVCAMGAVYRASINVAPAIDRATGRSRHDLYVAASARLLRALPGGVRNVPGWNDEAGRTKEEVIALYDRTIEKEERVHAV